VALVDGDDARRLIAIGCNSTPRAGEIRIPKPEKSPYMRSQFMEALGAHSCNGLILLLFLSSGFGLRVLSVSNPGAKVRISVHSLREQLVALRQRMAGIGVEIAW